MKKPAAKRKALAVLAVASEIYPLIKTGGLADVAGALPLALAAENIAVTTLVPGYPAVLAALGACQTMLDIPDLFGGPASIVRGKTGELDIMAIVAAHLYDRPGNPYLRPDGLDWPDNAQRFAALGAMAASIARGAIKGYKPALVHTHDWQAGIAIAYLAYGGHEPPPSVLTVHNLAFQGQFPLGLIGQLGLPASALRFDGIEHHGAIGYLKAGLQLASRITTVSPTYADEIRTAEGGMGLDGLLRYRRDAVSGIINGIDTEIWNPATDRHLAKTYDAASLKNRAANKAALQKRFGLRHDAKAPLLGVISRLSWQKGLDLLLGALPAIHSAGAQLVMLGAGDASLERGFAAAAVAHAGQIGVHIGYDEALAHQIQGGADMLVVPSRFEPCGLTQLCALRYGTVPVVARVGGLADTVEDGISGIVFDELTVEGLAAALTRAIALYAKPRSFAVLIQNGMARDVSWAKPARQYAELYRGIAKT